MGARTDAKNALESSSEPRSSQSFVTGSEVPESTFDALLRYAAASTPLPRPSLPLPVDTALASGRLVIRRRIGEGGMGVVYEAYDSERKAPVALKTLSRLNASNVYRLKNEFRALADVRHPNLIALHELFAQDDMWFFTMELIGGVRFDAWVRPDGVLQEARLRAALRQLLAALEAIHAAGKTHRDIKPSNVLVNAEGRVVVLDFGLVAAPEIGTVGQTVDEHAISGTPEYMAPEQAAGDAATRASDFYAVGVMMFEALTGRLPFEGHSGAILAAKQNEEPPRVSSVRVKSERVPDLEALCMQLLSREPTERPNASTLRELLGEQESSFGSGLGRDSTPEAPLLGRDDARQALRDAYRLTLGGTPVALLVSGESGMGKTAVVEAFLRELRAEGEAFVLSGRCYERENVPYKGLDAVVDELSRHLRKLQPQRAAALLPRDVFALARLFPVLDRVAVVADAPKKHIADPQALRARAFDAFGELIARIRDRQPLVIFVDDLQWTDRDSVQLLRHLILHGAPVPILFIGAHRSENAGENALLQSIVEAARNSRGISFRALALARLEQGALEALALRWLEDRSPQTDDDKPGMAQALAREALGSPFLVSVLARAALMQEDSARPPSLDEALAMQVKALPDRAERLLSLLALAGEPLPIAVAADAAGLEDGHGEVDLLRAERLARFSSDASGARLLECYHDKIRERVVRSLDERKTRLLAAQLVRALLATRDADPELLSRCLDTAGEREAAADQAAFAAARAMQALAFDRAAQLYERALDRCHSDDKKREHKLRLGLAEALAHGGRGVASAEAYLAARDSAAPDEAAALARKAAEQYLLCGRLERGREIVDEALRPLGIRMPLTTRAAIRSLALQRLRLRLRGFGFTARAQHDPQALIKLDALRKVAHCLVRTDPIRSVDFATRCTLLALQEGHAVELARSLNWEVMLGGLVGSSTEHADQIMRKQTDLCERTRDPLANEWLHYSRGIHRMFRYAQLEQALADFDHCLKLNAATASNIATYDRLWIHWQRGMAFNLQGRFVELERLAQAQLENAWLRGDLAAVPSWAWLSAVAHVALDEPERARIEIERARAAWRSDEVTLQDMSLLLGEVAAALYRGEAAKWLTDSAERRAHFEAPRLGRTTYSRIVQSWFCCVAVEAAQLEANPERRRAFSRAAAQHEKGAQRSGVVLDLPTGPAMACLAGRYDIAAQQLRTLIEAPHQSPVFAVAARRRLGALIGGAKGAKLVAEADAFLRAHDVVDPARFTTAVLPGVVRR
jgi:hypothetical protein